MASARFLDPGSVPLKRQSGGNIWATLIHLTQGIIFIVALSGILLFFVPVIRKTQQYREDQAALRIAIEKAQAQQQQIRLETEHMKSDPAYVEHIARDRLQMGRLGEDIVHFPPYQSAPPTPRLIRPTAQNEAR